VAGGGQGLVGEDVEGGAGEGALLKRLQQRRVVDQGAAGGVDR